MPELIMKEFPAASSFVHHARKDLSLLSGNIRMKGYIKGRNVILLENLPDSFQN